MFVKICGITTRSQAMEVAEAGADAIGFVFARSSPRFIAPETAREIVGALPLGVKAVGVFVDEPLAWVKAVAVHVGLDLVQLHGNEPPEYCKALAPMAIKAFRLRKEADAMAVNMYRGAVRAFLIDAWSPEAQGGTGLLADWRLAAQVIQGVEEPVILAGGLGVDNVAQAVEELSPKGVDASSRLELRPGFKDLALVRRFVAQARLTAGTN